MQAQAIRGTAVNTEVMTHTQSLAAVQTLLRAGLSCITFLRNLLPEDNFTETHLTTSDESFPASFSETEGGDTPQGAGKRSRVNGFRIKTLTRGYTDEADRILNYLENGIFDALQKQYLRSFIFAVYLDSKDPTNIVEAYTFNFKYHSVPGSNVPVPVMTLGDDLENMSLNGGKRTARDPVAEAIKSGKAPTVGDVKKSLRTMMKTLIQAITHMDELPRHRFATFKLFYTDLTPDDYEPPLFTSGDEKKDKWYFMTHNLEEVPDKFSVGKLNSGYHTVNLKVTSIATYLPSHLKDDTVPFAGTVTGAAAKGMPQRSRGSPNEEALSTARLAEQQKQDASARNLIWSADGDLELSDADADGEDDPDYVMRPDGTYEFKPLGMRTENGEIEDIVFPESAVRGGLEDETQSEARFAGMSIRVPTNLKEINSEGNMAHASDLQETQALLETQPMPMDPESRRNFSFDGTPHFEDDQKTPTRPERARYDGSLPPSNFAMELSPLSEAPPSPISEFDGKSSGRALSAIEEDTEMLDLETQPRDMEADIIDSIQSFSLNTVDPVESIQKATPAPATPAGSSSIKDVGLQCDCNITYEDESSFCEGSCGKWYHVWCMGYHSTDDPRLPEKFVCFDCRLRADPGWVMIEHSVYPQVMNKWSDFVTFRRAIKVAETAKAFIPAVFAKSFDDDSSLARQLLKKLEEEGYIHAVTTTVDEFGFASEIRARSHKAKDKKSRSRKNIQKSRFAFNKQIRLQQKYKDHFTPEPEVETRMIGLDDYRKFRDENERGIASRNRTKPFQAPKPLPDKNTVVESQTQQETQIMVPEDAVYKRNTYDRDEERPLKKLKISLAHGIDLAE